MNLHIFNPEHDIALSYNLPYVCVPHAAQELRMNLGFLPALWANDGDCVLVDDIKYALKAVAPLREFAADVLFVEKSDLRSLPIECVSAWGWDKRLRAELVDAGVSEGLLPTDSMLRQIREASDRRHTSDVLHEVRNGIEDDTCGEAYFCDTLEKVETLVERYEKIVVKAPWSSSGRGLRYISGHADDARKAWVSKTILRQGHVMVEPYYNKVADFAVEFTSDGLGNVGFSGLSVFHTVNGKYTGNVIASEENKRERLARYIDMALLDDVIRILERRLGLLIGNCYSGPLGVDMMIVADTQGKQFLLHPCVEINLRRTMGHVALALSSKPSEFARMMSIAHKVNYQFRVDRIEGKFVNVIFN